MMDFIANVLDMVAHYFNPAITIGAMALLLTFFTIRSTQRHNRLSVRPAICSWIHTEDDSFTLEIINKGFGLAEIDSYQFFIGSKAVSDDDLRADLTNFVGEPSVKILIGGFKKGSFFAKDEKFYALKFESLSVKEDSFYQSLYERYSLVIEYRSLYNDSYKYDSNDYEN